MSDYIDKINKNSTDYDIKDSYAARSVDGDSSHVEEANQIYTSTSQSQTDTFIYRTSAGSLSINSGDALLNSIYGNTVQTGHTDEVLTATGSFQTEGTTVALDKATWRALALENGTYSFNYDGTNWKLNSATVTLSTYGLTVTGTVANGDSIFVNYTALVVGTLTIATPSTFQATGFNQYDATAGYAHVKGENQYRIDGTYAGLTFATTPTGTQTAVTVTDNKFTPEEDGYIFVTGASGNILIALVWSGTMDSEPWAAYSTSTITIPTADSSSTALPTASYGFPSVHTVRDEIDFAGQDYVQRIGHYAYSAENLATVEAMGVDYIYDLTHILYVLETPVTYTLASSASSEYAVNDYGTEEFTGTSAGVVANITYGNSLVDKLRRLADVQTIGDGLSLSASGELTSSGGSGPTVVQTTGTSTADVMSQNAVTNTIFGDSDGYKVRIGKNAKTDGANAVAIGYDNKASGMRGVCCGPFTVASATCSVACGSNARATVQGQFDISTGVWTSGGYSGTGYRLLTGVYDGQSAHDAATVAQGNTLATSAPTTSTVGVLGQLYTDTTEMHTYQCTAIDGDTYTWTQRW